MRSFLSSSSKGLQITVELQPEWVVVGYGQTAQNAPIHAAVVIGYDSSQLPLVKVIAKGLRAQRRSPIVAIYDNTVQINFSTSPVTPECKVFALQHPVLSEVKEEIAGFNITSMADVFPGDDAYKIFQRCYEKDHALSLVLMEVATVEPQGGDGQPFEMFTVNELKDEFQRFF